MKHDDHKLHRERPFLVQHHRKGEETKVRRYAEVDNGVIGAIRWARTHGKVGDVFELSHILHGTQLGTVKIMPTGRAKAEWIWERA